MGIRPVMICYHRFLVIGEQWLDKHKTFKNFKSYNLANLFRRCRTNDCNKYPPLASSSTPACDPLIILPAILSSSIFNVCHVFKRGGGKLCCWKSTSVKIVNWIVEFFKSIANLVCLSRTSNRRLPQTFE